MTGAPLWLLAAGLGITVMALAARAPALLGMRLPAWNFQPIATFAVVFAAVMGAFLLASRAPSIVGPIPLFLLPVLIVLFLALPLWMLVTSRTGMALAVLLVYLGVVDGALKLQSSNELPGLGRDMLLYAIAVGMLSRTIFNRRPLEVPPLTGWVAAFAAVVLVQLANPGNGSLIHSVASLRQHLEFIPLFFIGYAALRSAERLRWFFVLLAAVAGINGAVAAVQISLTPDQLASWGPGYEGLITGSNGNAPRTAVGADGEQVVRPPGLGSDMGFAGVLGAVAIPGILALLMTGRGHRRQQLVAGILLAGATTAVVTSLSRSSTVAAAVAVTAFVLLVVLARPRKLPVLLVGGALAAVVVVGTVSLVTEGQEGKFDRLTSVAPDKAIGTTIESRRGTLALIPAYASDYPLGAGIGLVGPAAGVIDPPPASGLNAESQFTFFITELGIAGLLLFMGLNASLFWLLITRLRRMPYTEHVVLLAGLAAPLFAFAAIWVVGVNTTSTPNAPYFWLAAGVIAFWLASGRRVVGDPAGGRPPGTRDVG